MTAAGVWTYTLNNNDSAVQALNNGGTLSDTFTVHTADGTAQLVTITIDGTNDAAVLDLNGAGAGNDATASFTEQTPLAIAPSATITDVDSANMASLTATLTARPDGNAVESLSLNAAATAAAAGLTVSYTASAGVLSITGSASRATYQTILEGIVYNNTSDTPTTTARTVNVVINDGASNSAQQSVTISVTPVNDAPVLDLNGAGAGNDATASFTEQTPLAIAPSATITDVDSANMASLTATLTARPDGNAVESLSLNAAATAAAAGLTVSYTASAGVLSITGSASRATYQTILEGIVYNNTSDTPTTTARTVNVVINDGASNSAQQSVTISVTPVNDAPVLDLNGAGAGNDATASFTEQTPLAIAPSATITDVDSANMASLTATLTARPDGNAVESLSLNAAATAAAAGLSVSYTASTGVLSITGSASRATYQTILEGIVYNNTSDTPTTTARTVNVVINDGASNSAQQSVTISVTPVNDAAVLDLNGAGAGNDATASFTEQTPLAIAPSATITDVDSANMASLTATLTARPDGNAVESLSLNAAATAAAAGLSVSYTASTGVLSITGSASRATYQTILEGIVYNNTSDTPTTTARTVNVVINDGASNSAQQSVTISVTPVNDAAVLDLNGAGAGNDATASFTEQTPLAIAPSATITDVDSANMASLTATLTARPDGNAVESLSLNAAATAAAAGLTVSYTASAGVLSITGSASRATYQTILEGIVYNNTSDTPTTTARTVNVVINDGASNSAQQSVTISVTPVNDAPVLDLNGAGAGNDATASFTEQTPLAIAPSATITDVDSANMASLTATLTARPDGNAVESLSLNAAATAAAAGLSVSYTASTGVLSITGSASRATYQTILEGIVYNNTSDTPTTTARTVNVVINDGASNSAQQSVTIS